MTAGFFNYNDQSTVEGLPGLLSRVNEPYSASNRAAGGAVAKQQEVAANTATTGATYSFDFVHSNGETKTVTFVLVGATLAAVATEAAAAFNADPLVSSEVVATPSGSDVTLDGRTPGNDWSLDRSTGETKVDATTTNTAAAQAGAVPFGLLVCAGPTNAECRLPNSSNATPQVDTVTVTAEDNCNYRVRVLVDADGDGVEEEYLGEYLSDGTATTTEVTAGLTSALNTALPANSVDVVDADPDLTLTSEVPGLKFRTLVEVSNPAGGAGALALANTTANVSLEVLGLSVLSDAREGSSGPNAVSQYGPGEQVNYLTSGRLYAVCDAGQSPSSTDRVYARFTATGTQQLGALRTDADSGTAFPVPRLKWVGSAFTFKGKTLCEVRVVEGARA